MKSGVFVLAIISVFASTILGQVVADVRSDDQMIDAVITRPWPGSNYPPLPVLPIDLRNSIKGEIRDLEVRKAYEKLEATRRNVEWFDGIAILEKRNALWSLLSCLVHPSDDVQIYSLRSLGQIKDKRAIPFLLKYAESMAVLEGGSENATLHGIIHETIAKTMFAITGIKVRIKGQDPGKLMDGIKMWRAWYETQI